jgi:hypothetical protein
MHCAEELNADYPGLFLLALFCLITNQETKDVTQKYISTKIFGNFNFGRGAVAQYHLQGAPPMLVFPFGMMTKSLPRKGWDILLGLFSMLCPRPMRSSSSRSRSIYKNKYLVHYGGTLGSNRLNTGNMPSVAL